MPVILSQVANDAAKQPLLHTPRFFDSTATKITGRGGATGLLSEMRNPIHTPHDRKTDSAQINPLRRTKNTPGLRITYVPMFVVSSIAWNCIREIPLPVSTQSKRIATDAFGDIKWYLRVHAHSMTVEKDTTPPPQNGTGRTTHPANALVTYRIDLTRVVDDSNQRSVVVHEASATKMIQANANATCHVFTQNVPAAFESIIRKLERAGQVVDNNAIADYLRNLSLYDLVCERSQAWQETLDEECEPLFESLANINTGDAISGQEANALRECVHRLESYGVPLDIYGRIYESMKRNFKPAAVTGLCKENLNIMLSDLMAKLKANKSSLTCVPKVHGVHADPSFSDPQAAAIESDKSLNLVQATAGSGKTKTILGRIDYMVRSGIKPEDIMAISFTNAAADHITELNPDVKSMTIDAYITAIYRHNFPDQNVSTASTLANGIDVYFPKNLTAKRLGDLITQVDNNVEGSFTALNRHVEQHCREVAQICQTVGHVTLSLAIVLCYQLIDILQEPDEVKASHLIVDEVQDTSIFQFIYTLEHVNKYRQSLFMVGKPRGIAHIKPY